MSRYASPYGPKFRPQLNIAGFPIKSLKNVGLAAGAFSAVAGCTVIYILEGVPRVQNDVLKKIPLIGGYWCGKETPASDNPF